MKIVIALLIAATAVVALPSANDIVPEESLVQVSAFQEAKASVDALLQEGKDEGACASLADASIKEVEDAVASQQKILDSMGTGASCPKEGQPAVDAAKAALQTAEENAQGAQQALDSANTAPVTFAAVGLDELDGDKCDIMFEDEAYKKAEQDIKDAKKAKGEADGAVAAAKQALQNAQDTQAQMVSDCQCAVRAKYDKAWESANANNDADKKSYTKGKHMKCVLAGTAPNECVVGDIPKVKAITLADGVPAKPCEHPAEGPLAFTNAQVSSEYHGTPASRAIDGNTNQHWNGGSCTHTMNWGHPWWNADFVGGAKAVKKVEIWNRSDCCQNRLSGAKVYVKTIGGVHQECDGTATSGSVSTFQCKDLIGDNLSVNLQKTDYLTLCEVKATGYAPLGGSKHVTCKLTIDNAIDSVKYNGEPLTIHGNKGDWTTQSQIDFTATGNGVLEVSGRNYENNSCKTGSFAISCQSEDMFWGSFTSDSSHIQASSGDNAAGDDFGGLCDATGGKGNNVFNGLGKSIWAASNGKHVAFKMGPGVNA